MVSYFFVSWFLHGVQKVWLSYPPVFPRMFAVKTRVSIWFFQVGALTLAPIHGLSCFNMHLYRCTSCHRGLRAFHVVYICFLPNICPVFLPRVCSIQKNTCSLNSHINRIYANTVMH